LAERVLVTGATGFIGFHLVRELSNSGASVTCLVRPTSDTKTLESFNPAFASGDVLQKDTLLEPTSNADVVIHLVGAQESFHPQDYYDMNVGGTRNLVEACATSDIPPIFVYVSSLTAAGPSLKGDLLTERNAPSPISHYGRSKLAAEEVVRAWAHEVPSTIIRPPMVFGERDVDMYQMFQAINLGLHPILPPKGSRYTVIHAEDLVQGLISAARNGERINADAPVDPTGTGVYYIGADSHPTYKELGELISAGLGRKRVLMFQVPRTITWIVASIYELGSRIRRKPSIVSFDKARDAFAGSWVCSSEKAVEQLGFKPSKSIEQRMRQTADWYLEHGWL
jgi:nucleoside-diphosphate-sugar epimerase